PGATRSRVNPCEPPCGRRGSEVLSKNLAPMEQLPLQARAGTAFGLGMAAIVTTVFGFFWFGWGMGYGSVQWYCWVALYLAAIALVVFAVRAMRAGKALCANTRRRMIRSDGPWAGASARSPRRNSLRAASC